MLFPKAFDAPPLNDVDRPLGAQISPTAVSSRGERKCAPSSPISVVQTTSSLDGFPPSDPPKQGDHQTLIHPIERGVIKDWDALEALLYDVLYTQVFLPTFCAVAWWPQLLCKRFVYSV
jgi:hypothetical protein